MLLQNVFLLSGRSGIYSNALSQARCKPTLYKIQSITTSTSTRQADTRTRKEERYRLKDNIPHDYRIIYRAPMEYYLSACNFVTSFSFAAMSGITAYAYLRNYNITAVPFDVEYGPLTANESDLMLFLGFFLIANVVIRIVVNRYPLRIYRSSEKYFAVFEGYLPFTRKKLLFQKGEVWPVPQGGIVPWQDARYKINDKPVLLLEDYFRTPAELNAMLKK
ncbi:uncharacterized protein LOC129724381 isoform X3 [Wyeomyia smithii]|uniref:uncharacterized protein LOC129724381 isoform X3 n=1 Tax=Wyeomyia smithii TaxID=174621 RepID=UPI002467C799|nr:uncharacterized protein LOC129724381 isoform X3 [Wyeomyia smithii]